VKNTCVGMSDKIFPVKYSIKFIIHRPQDDLHDYKTQIYHPLLSFSKGFIFFLNHQMIMIITSRDENKNFTHAACEPDMPFEI